MKLTKLDRRHTGFGIMKYYVEPEPTWVIGMDMRFRHFQEWRAWCWEVFGPGVERKYITVTPMIKAVDFATGVTKHGMEAVERWAWHTEEKEMRLYFKDDETASAFSFQWS